MSVSIIIPALNEAETIQSTLASLRQGAGSAFEVVVVDNGSHDDTAALAEAAGAQVLDCEGGTVAAVRNAGVANASGRCLVFLDADVRVQEGWHARIETVAGELDAEPMRVTGARLKTSGQGGFLERHWFSRLGDTEANYINSGHLVTSRTLFDAIGGFDASLRTAEDYDFCVRAREHGATVADDPSLVAVHDGYPATWSRFVRREAWHGGQDFSSLQRFLASRVAWIATFNAVAAITAVGLAFSGWPVALLLYLLGMSAVCVGLSIAKFRGRIGFSSGLFATALVFFAYIWGRTLSMLPMFRERGR